MTVLDVAASQVGVTEVPPNTNRGPKVEEYLATVGLNPGDPWCAAFVGYCGKQAMGGAWPVPLVGGCASLGAWATKTKRLTDAPAPGYLFLLWFPKLKRFAHTGFVVDQVAGGWATIEGNTSGGGSREGWGVYRRVRQFGPRDRYIYLNNGGT